MLPRTHLIRLQREFYDRLRGYARRFLGGLSPELKRYFLEYQRDFQDYQEVSSKRELLWAIQKSHVIFCGDYHTLSQAQRTVIRLLRESIPLLRRRGRNPVIALEMVRPKDNPFIEKYLKGQLSESAFLKAVQFQKNWGFAWENYRPLFEFARKQKLKVIGINLEQKPGKKRTLKARDKYSADAIAQYSQENPKAQLFVLVGDLHLARGHLPKQTKLCIDKRKISRRLLVIHQNNERFYWKLVEKGLEQMVEVLKVRDNVYCVMNTPPWMKLKSHLKWAELATQEEEIEEDAVQALGYHEEIQELVHMIGEFLKLPKKTEDDFSLIGPFDTGRLRQISRGKGYRKKELAFHAKMLQESKSHYLPKTRTIFLKSLSLNHTAQEAAIYLHAVHSGFSETFQNPQQDFYRFIWVEALGYFGSKIINHKRKCSDQEDFKKAMLQEKPKSKRRQVYALALSHLIMEQTAKRKKFDLPGKNSSVDTLVTYFKTAKLLGAMLGHALYSATMHNKISRQQIKRLYTQSLTPQEAESLYFKWIARLDRFGYRRIAKAERL